jgi:hypothetical protein
MPKTRKRLNQKGAKSVSVRIKHKIGGRKSTRGVKQMSSIEMARIFDTCRPRDRFKILRENRGRIAISVSPE